MPNARTLLAAAVVVAAAAVGGYYFLAPTVAPDQGAGDELAINLGNNTWSPLTKFEYAPTGSDAFVEASLTEPLGAGDFFDLSIAGGKAQCHYDLRITNDKGEVSGRSDVDLCAATFYHVEIQ